MTWQSARAEGVNRVYKCFRSDWSHSTHGMRVTGLTPLHGIRAPNIIRGGMKERWQCLQSINESRAETHHSKGPFQCFVIPCYPA